MSRNVLPVTLNVLGQLRRSRHDQKVGGGPSLPVCSRRPWPLDCPFVAMSAAVDASLSAPFIFSDGVPLPHSVPRIFIVKPSRQLQIVPVPRPLGNPDPVTVGRPGADQRSAGLRDR